MEQKILFQIGNLFTGYPYGVEVELPFENLELHGPFSSENEANTYAHALVEKRIPRPEGSRLIVGAKVVKIETPQVGTHIVLGEDNVYRYASEEAHLRAFGRPS